MPIIFNADRSPAHIYTRTNAGVFSADLATTANFDYFPNTITAGDATKEEIRIEMDNNSIKLKNIDQNVGGLY